MKDQSAATARILLSDRRLDPSRPTVHRPVPASAADAAGTAYEEERMSLAPGAHPADDEYRRHKSDSRRPGQAGSAAATRARLMSEIAGMENALALTERAVRGDGVCPPPRVRIARDETMRRKPFATGSGPERPWRGTRDALTGHVEENP